MKNRDIQTDTQIGVLVLLKGFVGECHTSFFLFKHYFLGILLFVWLIVPPQYIGFYFKRQMK